MCIHQKCVAAFEHCIWKVEATQQHSNRNVIINTATSSAHPKCTRDTYLILSCRMLILASSNITMGTMDAIGYTLCCFCLYVHVLGYACGCLNVIENRTHMINAGSRNATEMRPTCKHIRIYKLEFNEHTHIRTRAQMCIRSLTRSLASQLGRESTFFCCSIKWKTDRFRRAQLNINLRARTRSTREMNEERDTNEMVGKICNQWCWLNSLNHLQLQFIQKQFQLTFSNNIVENRRLTGEFWMQMKFLAYTDTRVCACSLVYFVFAERKYDLCQYKPLF